MGRHNTADYPDSPGGYAPSSGQMRRRGGRGAAVVAFSASLAVLIALGVTGWMLFRTEGPCIGRNAELSVAGAPELAPALTQVADDFAAGEDCLNVEVIPAGSADIAYGITGRGPTSGDTEADVWVPDASLWAQHVVSEAGPDAVEITGTSIASSPIVLASTGPADDETSWGALVPTQAPQGDADATAVHLAEPTVSSSGLATLALIYGALQGQLAGVDEDDDEDSLEAADAQASPEFIAALQNLQQGVAIDIETAAANLSEEDSGSNAVLALPEQAAWRYNSDNADAPIQVRYPTEGTYSLDYPFLLRDPSRDASRLAEEFRDFVRTDEAQSVIRDHGFRSPDGTVNDGVFDSEQGFQDDEPPGLPTPTDEAVAELTAAWNQLRLGTRMLTIYDTSGSMLNEVPGTDATRIEVTVAAAAEGLALFDDDAEIGVWEFSTDLDNGLHHREVTPIRQLDTDVDGTTHREQLFGALAQLEPRPRGDTALYETILAAHREMQESYAPDRSNVILLFTDGEQDNPDGDLALEELLSTLEDEVNPEQPVPVIILNYGPSIDTTPMQQVAELTGGESFETSNPEEIGQIFLEGFALRLGAGGDPDQSPEEEEVEDPEDPAEVEDSEN